MNAAGRIFTTLAVVLSVSAIVVSRSHSHASPRRDWEPRLARVVADLKGLETRLGTLECAPIISSAQAIPDVPPPESGDPPKGPSKANPETELDRLLQELFEKGVLSEATEQLLESVRKRKEQQAFLKAIRRRLSLHPDDAKAHYLHARALIELLMTEPSYAGKDELGNQALAAYDRAIALDPRYWEPRFEKAESLTYYPESLGKTPEAIRELEALLALQAGSNQAARFAKPYAHLARMYLRIGKTEQALRIVEEGVRLFPNDEDLRSQLEILQRK